MVVRLYLPDPLSTRIPTSNARETPFGVKHIIAKNERVIETNLYRSFLWTEKRNNLHSAV